MTGIVSWPSILPAVSSAPRPPYGNFCAVVWCSPSRAAGKIIFISSVHEDIPWAGHVNYSASKGGIRMLMKSMALELAPAEYPGQLHRPRGHQNPDQP